MRTTEGQLEPGTRLKCGQCGSEFVPKNRNGIKARFCSGICRDRFKNAQRLKGAALLRDKPAARRGPSRHAQRVSRFVFLPMVPVEQRAELLRQAALNLGITEEGDVLKALRRNGCAAAQHSALRTQHLPEATV